MGSFASGENSKGTDEPRPFSAIAISDCVVL